jgi:hypothetical protein
MQYQLPPFEPDEVSLLISAVEQALQTLYQANERQGGNDREFIELGRRYSVLLQKLQAVQNPPVA